jgi:hypothetical protein
MTPLPRMSGTTTSDGSKPRKRTSMADTKRRLSSNLVAQLRATDVTPYSRAVVDLAADKIELQQEQIERLRESLERIAAMHSPPYISAPGIAVKALRAACVTSERDLLRNALWECWHLTNPCDCVPCTRIREVVERTIGRPDETEEPK